MGLSTSWLSQVERGVRPVEKLAVILALAEALQCEPRDLVGGNPKLGPNGGLHFRALPRLQRVLTSYDALLGLAEGEGPVSAGRDLAQLQGIVDGANRQYQSAHYEEAAGDLVLATEEAERARRVGSSVDARAAFRLLAQSYQAIAKILTKLHETELSRVAVERAGAAEQAEDWELAAATAYHLGHSLRRAGRARDALGVVERS